MNIVLIGLGMVADTHLAAIHHSDKGLRLAGVYGRDSERTLIYADKAATLVGHDVLTFSSAEAIARDPQVDFAILATPPNARLPLVRALAAQGKPILMEKPVERDLAAAREIVEICEAAEVPLGIVFQHRARPASQALKQALAGKRLGQIATVDIRVPWWRDQAYYDVPGRGTYARDGGGVMISQAIHTLDLALWLLGPMTSVQAMMRTTPLHRMEAEDWAGAAFEMACGACGTLMATTAAHPGEAESITLRGTRATAHLAAGALTITDLDGHTETHGTAAATGGGADPMAFTHDWHRAVIEDFAEAVRNGSPPMATGRSALAAHAAIDAMQRSSDSGQAADVEQI